MRRWMLLPAAVAAVSSLHAETLTLPDIVVTPMRSSTPAADVPYSAFTVGPGGAGAAPRTTPEALQGLPSVMVQKTSYGQGSPFLRGFTGFRTLLMIDGVRLNNSVFRDGPNQYWNTVDPFGIDRYEAVLGPASVLYGSDAIGGAVNAIPSAPPAGAGQPSWDRSLRYRGATADQSHQARMDLGTRVSEALGLRGGYTWKAFDDVEGGRDVGRQPFTGYDEQAWDARADYVFETGAMLSLAHQSVRQDDAWRTHRTIYGIEWKGLSKGDDQVHVFDQSRDLTWLRLAGEPAGSIDGYSLTVSRHAQGEDLDRLRATGRRDLQGFDVETWGATLTLESETAAGRWVYGADYYRDFADSYGIRIDPEAAPKASVQGPVADDATYDLVGVFVQDTIGFADGAIELTPGVRYTYADLNAEKVDKTPGGVAGNWDAVVGSLRALVALDGERVQTLFAGISQGFRAPNLSDLTRLDSARSNEIETPVDELDPERFVTSEIGWRRLANDWSASLSYYYTAIDDLIVRAPTGEVIDDLQEVTKKNSGEGHVQGIEATARVRFGGDWVASAMATWMEGKVETFPTSDPVLVEDDLSRVMPLTGRLALRWSPAGKSYWAEIAIDAAAKADRLSADDARDTQRIPPGGTPAYAVFAARGGMDFAEGVSLSIGLENLADEDYRIHGSGVNEPGRQLVVSARAAF